MSTTDGEFIPVFFIPVFASDVYSYSMNVANSVDSITVRAEPNLVGPGRPGSTVTVQGRAWQMLLATSSNTCPRPTLHYLLILCQSV